MDKVYKQVLDELKRLTGKELSPEQRHEIFQEYIYSKVPPSEISKLIKGNNSLVTYTLPDGLKLEPILRQTLKMLGIMEIAEDFEEFEKFAGKKKQNPKELTDFDKILKGIMEVPKNESKPDKPSE